MKPIGEEKENFQHEIEERKKKKEKRFFSSKITHHENLLRYF